MDIDSNEAAAGARPASSGDDGRIRRVALLVSTGSGYGRGICRGVNLYVRPVKPWIFHIAVPRPHVVPLLRDWRPEGIVAHVDTPQLAEALTGLRVPLVNVSSALARPGEIPTVCLDNELAGAMAAEHLLARGFEHFGFCGDVVMGHSLARRAGFCRAVADAGFACHTFEHQTSDTFDDRPETARGVPWTAAEAGLEQWVRSLPKPAAVMAAQDYLGLTLSEVCRRAGIRVPEEVALVGVDNDELACELAYPPLSSVRSPTDRIGFEAAQLLDELMAGGAPPAGRVLVPPSGVVTRQSSDIMATDDPHLAAVLRFIRQHADQPIGVDDILRQVPISRRAMEQRFKALLGRTPLAEIHRVHVEQAKRLLAETDLPVAAVALKSGFNSAERLGVVFAQHTGRSPHAYRKQFRGNVDRAWAGRRKRAE